MESETICHYCGEKLPHEKCSLAAELAEARKKPETTEPDDHWSLEGNRIINANTSHIAWVETLGEGRIITAIHNKAIDRLTAENKEEEDRAEMLNKVIEDLNAHLKAKDEEMEEWRNQEGSVCPEDVSFYEYVGVLKAHLNAKDDVLRKIKDWCRAYPLEAFPKPDKEYFAKAHAILKQNELSLTRISADNMRHVLVGIQKIIEGEAKDV